MKNLERHAPRLIREVRGYLDGLHQRSAALQHLPCRFAREVAAVLDQLGVVTWSSTVGPLELHLVQAKSPGDPTEIARTT